MANAPKGQSASFSILRTFGRRVSARFGFELVLTQQADPFPFAMSGNADKHVWGIIIDDQVLLQLGAYGNYDESQKQRYIAGLRQLLTGFRDRKVKDFKTISEAIVAYRAQFIGDKSKILPLGGVTI